MKSKNFIKISILAALCMFSLFFSACQGEEKKSKEEQLVVDFETAYTENSLTEGEELKDFEGVISAANGLYKALVDKGYDKEDILSFVDAKFSYVYTGKEGTPQSVSGRSLIGDISDLEEKRAGFEQIKLALPELQKENETLQMGIPQKVTVAKEKVFSDGYKQVWVLQEEMVDKKDLRVLSYAYVFKEGKLQFSPVGIKYKQMDTTETIDPKLLEKGWVIRF